MERLVACMRAISSTEDETVPEHYCHEAKPLTEQACNTDACPPEWVAGKWQRVSTLIHHLLSVCQTTIGKTVKKFNQK